MSNDEEFNPGGLNPDEPGDNDITDIPDREREVNGEDPADELPDAEAPGAEVPGEETGGGDEAADGVTGAQEESEPPSLKLRIKRNIIRFGIIFIFLFIVFIGLTVMLYPSISNYVNEKNASRVIDSYSDALSSMSQTDYTEALEAAYAYNSRLAGTETTVSDAFSSAADDVDRTDEYWNLLSVVSNGMMGYIEIEELDIMLPLYHGVSEAVLAQGAGHLQGSSLPVGGESTHAIITAHTGLPRAKLFTGIDTLEIGDTFALNIMNEVLTYEVDQILTVLPHEVDELAITRGQDYVTLVTCTPYGINSHRLLVRGARIETPETAQPVSIQTAEAEDETLPWYGRAFNRIVEFFSMIVEVAANGIVSFAEWGMDIFGVEY